MFVGMLLLILGVLMLLDKLGVIYGDVWDYFIPAAIIAVGFSIIFKHRECKRS